MADPQESENDILTITNPDLNCSEITSEVTFNPVSGGEVAEQFNHKDYFQVKWAGVPHRIAPGETRKMPRFLANHFAKHLADHILLKKEKDENRKGLMSSPVERPMVLSQIILGVDEYFISAGSITEGEQVAKEVESINPTQAPPPEPEKVEPQEELKTSVWDASKPKPTRAELIAEIEKLDMLDKVKPEMKVDDLIKIVQSF